MLKNGARIACAPCSIPSALFAQFDLTKHTWFEWAEQVRRSGSRPAGVMSGQAAAGRYESTRAALFAAPQPFWEYWERQASMSTLV